MNDHPRHFMVLTTQRTGSSWLMDRINGMPGAQGHMELFYEHPRREPPRAGRNDYDRFVETVHASRRPRATFAYLDRFYSWPPAAGFKLMYSQLRRYPEILPYLALRRLAVIHLLRVNHLDVIVSEALARATGRSHATVAEGRGQPRALRLETARLVDRVRRLQRKQAFMRRLLRLLPNPVLEISYERLCAGDAGFAVIRRFLGLPADAAQASPSRLLKRQQAAHRDVIANYEEVRRVLVGAGYEGLLH